MLAARKDDGRFGSFTPVYGTTPGIYRPTPPALAPDPAPWVGNVRPFVVPDVEMLCTRPPNALTSRTYARDFNEIKEIGSLHSTTRTPDETSSAIFWQDHAFALWNRTFRSLAASRHLDIVDHARLFATENLAAADVAIGCWNNKYLWNTWRPITAVREGASDGHRATEAGPHCSIRPRRSPRCPHSSPRRSRSTPQATTAPPARSWGRSGTASTPTGSRSARPATRRRRRAAGAASPRPCGENINARVWAGIHFRQADLAGAELGKKVARYLHNHDLQPRF
jgi:hypothetical protein